MTSRMHIEKKEGLVIPDWYFGERMETNGAVEKVKKERNDEIFFKNCVYTQNKPVIPTPCY